MTVDAAETEITAFDLEGQHDHTVDGKGRVSIPAEFRGQLGLTEADELIVTRHVNQRCLLIYPVGAWGGFKAEIEASDQRVRTTLRRVVVGSARRVRMDRLGRIQLPQVLRRFAQLDGKCFVVGQGQRIEVWDISVWNEMFAPEQLGDVDLTGLNL